MLSQRSSRVHTREAQDNHEPLFHTNYGRHTDYVLTNHRHHATCRKTYIKRIILTTSTSVSSKKRIILFFNTTLKNNRLKTCAFTTIFTSPNTRSSRQPTKKHVYKINYIPIAIHQYHPRSSSHYVRIVSAKTIHDKNLCLHAKLNKPIP